MYHTTAIGIMDEAYFCPRQQIVRWVNQTLNLNIEIIEDLGTGSVYCQLLDYAFGQRVPMQKVNWKAKFEYEFIANMKVFQNTLEKLGITRKIDVRCFMFFRFKSLPKLSPKITLKSFNRFKDILS